MLFLHDSICHGLDIDRLLANSDHKGVKQTTYTVGDARAAIRDNVSNCNLIMIHVGINNLKDNDVETVFPEFVELIKEAKSKSKEVFISMLTPARIIALDRKVMQMNDLIYKTFSKEENIILCINDNFCTRDNKIVEKLYFNNTKLSDEGVRLLAGNIRRTLIPNDSRRSPGKFRPKNYNNSVNYASSQYNYWSPPRDRERDPQRYKVDSTKLANSIAQAIALAFN